MTIEIIISKIEELLGYSNVKFDKEVNDNYFFTAKDNKNKNVYIRRNYDGKVFIKVEAKWKQFIGLLIV